MTAREAAGKLDIPYGQMLNELRRGKVKAKRYRGRWQIKDRDLYRLCAVNQGRADWLRRQYVKMYREGWTVDGLRQIVSIDLDWYRVIADPRDFVERAIYQDTLRRSV